MIFLEVNCTLCYNNITLETHTSAQGFVHKMHKNISELLLKIWISRERERERELCLTGVKRKQVVK
jgi:hypothetical protein